MKRGSDLLRPFSSKKKGRRFYFDEAYDESDLISLTQRRISAHSDLVHRLEELRAATLPVLNSSYTSQVEKVATFSAYLSGYEAWTRAYIEEYLTLSAEYKEILNSLSTDNLVLTPDRQFGLTQVEDILGSHVVGALNFLDKDYPEILAFLKNEFQEEEANDLTGDEMDVLIKFRKTLDAGKSKLFKQLTDLWKMSQYMITNSSDHPVDISSWKRWYDTRLADKVKEFLHFYYTLQEDYYGYVQTLESSGKKVLLDPALTQNRANNNGELSDILTNFPTHLLHGYNEEGNEHSLLGSLPFSVRHKLGEFSHLLAGAQSLLLEGLSALYDSTLRPYDGTKVKEETLTEYRRNAMDYNISSYELITNYVTHYGELRQDYLEYVQQIKEKYLGNKSLDDLYLDPRLTFTKSDDILSFIPEKYVLFYLVDSPVY